MPIFAGHDSARALENVTSNTNHTRMAHGDPFAIYTKAASGYVGFAPGIQFSALRDIADLQQLQLGLEPIILNHEALT